MTPNVLSETLSHLCSRANQQLLSLLPSPATMAFMTHLHAQVSKHLVSISCVSFQHHSPSPPGSTNHELFLLKD